MVRRLLRGREPAHELKDLHCAALALAGAKASVAAERLRHELGYAGLLSHLGMRSPWWMNGWVFSGKSTGNHGFYHQI